jgi:hypothetical protein
MAALYKYLKKSMNGFNISPFGSGNIIKLFIYAVWGFNVLLFLNHDFSVSPEYTFPCKANHNIKCTLLHKVKSAYLHVEYIKVRVNTPFIVIHQVNYVLPSYDVIIQPNERSPPLIIFS